jgi:hypothetical protein
MTKTLDFVNSFQKINLPLYGVRLPEFKVKAEHKRNLGLSEDASNTDFLKKLAYNNLPKKKVKSKFLYKNNKLNTIREKSKDDVFSEKQMSKELNSFKEKINPNLEGNNYCNQE